MPTITRTIARGIPPRTHEPKTKGKAKARGNGRPANTVKSSQRRKRHASEGSESEGSEGSDSSESEPKAKKKKPTKRQRIEEIESEVEVVEIEDEEQVEDVDVRGSPDTREDGLTAHHRGAELETKPVKKDSTLDLLTIMTDKVTVNFKVARDKYETETGRWCNICKNDDRFLKIHGKRKAFHKGGNSSCRLHIRQHYDIYSEKCEQAGIPINHWAIPREIWKVMEEEREAEKQGNRWPSLTILHFETRWSR
ncbi:hypothetical protein BJ912DRAFT_1022250 [Pholiota molesta]|nr:hypothetical protein BJ912DRAFT_1022250 [Pholiota molesta]